MQGPLPLSFCAAVNDPAVLNSTLLASPGLPRECEFLPRSGFSSAGAAYNSALDSAANDLVVFVHQDVYLPSGWTDKLWHLISTLDKEQSGWGVLGVCGVDSSESVHAWLHSTGLGRPVGREFPHPTRVRVLDEVLLILRRSSNLRFDAALPGFHLYGTDICLSAEASGLKNFALPLFLLHNSNGIEVLPTAFWRAYRYMRSKWKPVLPVTTPCVTITSSPVLPLAVATRQWIYAHLRRRQPGRRVADPHALFDRLSTS